MHELTASGSYSLVIKLNGRQTNTLKWTTFSVGSESNNYRLSVSGFDRGPQGGKLTLGDRLQDHNGRGFHTRDRLSAGGSTCPLVNGGVGWWYTGCWQCHLNWGYSRGPQYNGDNDESIMILKRK